MRVAAAVYSPFMIIWRGLERSRDFETAALRYGNSLVLLGKRSGSALQQQLEQKLWPRAVLEKVLEVHASI
jgi:hypothetical protein